MKELEEQEDSAVTRRKRILSDEPVQEYQNNGSDRGFNFLHQGLGSRESGSLQFKIRPHTNYDFEIEHKADIRNTDSSFRQGWPESGDLQLLH